MSKKKDKPSVTLSDEQRERFAPMLHKTWGEIAYDGEKLIPRKQGPKRTSQIIELVIDANRVQTFGGMNDEDYKALCAAYNDPATVKWLQAEFKTS